MTDLDGDGQLDLLLAHGESAEQPISVFKVTQVCMCMCCLKQKRQHNNVDNAQSHQIKARFWQGAGERRCSVIRWNSTLTNYICIQNKLRLSLTQFQN